MSAHLSSNGMITETTGWEQEHPGVLSESIWVFSSKCIWKRRSIALTIILLLKFQGLLDLSLQGQVQAFTQHCFSILVALTVSNCNGVVREPMS